MSEKKTRKAASKGSSKNFRGKRSRARTDDLDEKSVRSRNSDSNYDNDPGWYAANAQLLTDAASLAFSNALGTTSKPPVGTEYFHPERSYTEEAVPGILTLSTISVPGISTDNSSPVNVAARNLYSFVRHANSGHSNYDSPDLMMYVLALDSAYTFWAWMVRAYGVMMSYSHKNRYYAKHIVTAMGFDYDDLLAHLADFRSFINTYAFKLGSICCPASFTFITRHVWMMSHIWLDSPSSKAQTYMYVPEAFWVYDETSSDTGGQLHLTESLIDMTIGEIQSMGNSMLSKILESEDLMIMSGDILKAFGADKIMKVTTIPENFMILPAYSEEVCSQFQNATVTGMWDDGVTISQNPDTGAIIFSPDWSKHQVRYPRRVTLNLRKEQPSPADVMVATRLTCIFQDEPGAYYLNTCGSEICVHMRTHRLVKDPNTGSLFTRQDYYLSGITIYPSLITDTLDIVASLLRLEKFDWHPFIYVSWTQNPGDEGEQYLGTAGDYDNYTYISDYELLKMNQTALLSEFGCPNMGAFANATK